MPENIVCMTFYFIMSAAFKNYKINFGFQVIHYRQFWMQKHFFFFSTKCLRLGAEGSQRLVDISFKIIIVFYSWKDKDKNKRVKWKEARRFHGGGEIRFMGWGNEILEVGGRGENSCCTFDRGSDLALIRFKNNLSVFLSSIKMCDLSKREIKSCSPWMKKKYVLFWELVKKVLTIVYNLQKKVCIFTTASFIKPYRNSVDKCVGSR